MTVPDKKGREALARLANAMVDDVMAASDRELLNEFAETHTDPSKKVAELRARFEETLIMANKSRLRAAQSALASSRDVIQAPTVISMEKVRERLRRTLASCPPEVKLTLAARNESELSDDDVLGMLQDLEELGIVVSDDGQGGRW